MDFKATALNQAAEGKRALQVNPAKVNELSKEISDMKDAIHQLKLAATQNQQEHGDIVKERDDLRECYKTGVEEAEKKLLVLRKEYEPELSRTLESKLIETTSEIESLREEMKKAHESEMNTVKVITNELNEASDEECSLRSLVNSIRMELEDMRREREELQHKEAERLETEERKKLEALKEESLKLEQMKLEAVRARNEAEEMNIKIESLKKETDSAMIAAEEAEKRLELVIREVQEAKAAEEKVREEMKMISQKQERKKHDESSGSQEFESLKRGAGETEKAMEEKLAELEEINARKTEADSKVGASLKAIEEMNHATELAQKSAESAEAAKSVVESELNRWRQQENVQHA